MLVVALLAAIATSYKLPSMQKRSLAVGAATGQILVDSDPSTLVAGAGTDQIAALGSRAQVYAQYLSSRDAVGRIADQTGVPAPLITARGPFSQGTGVKNYQQQPAESRAKDLTDEGKRYRLVFEAQADVPIITVYSTGPTAGAALKLAQSSFATLQQYVAELKKHGGAGSKAGTTATTTGTTTAVGVPVGPDDVVVRQLGEPEAGVVGGSADKAMMLMAFIAVLGIQMLGVAMLTRYREQSKLAREGGGQQAQAQPQPQPQHPQAAAANGSQPTGPQPVPSPRPPGDVDPRWRATYARG
jgi:hypothetical protein